MVYFADIKGQFSKAAGKNLLLQDSPNRIVSKEMFEQILEPINQIMINNPVYSNVEIDIPERLKELRQICSDVQVRHVTDDYILKIGRSELLNALQSLLESSKVANNGNITANNEDLFALANLSDVIRENAKIYREFMKSPLIADALYQTADNIDAAQERLWKAGIHRGYSLPLNLDEEINRKYLH